MKDNNGLGHEIRIYIVSYFVNIANGCNVHINLCPEFTFTPRFIGLCHGKPVLHFPVLQIPVRQCQSFIFRPFCSVRHSPVRQFPLLQLRSSFSSLASSTPAISSVSWQSVIFYPCDFVRHLPVLHFPVLQIQLTHFCTDEEVNNEHCYISVNSES